MLLLQAQLDPAGYDTMAAVLFYLFALMAGGSAVAVVVSRNVVRMAVALLFTLAGVAGLYFLLNAEFLAAVQLVVYAGGTLILIIFAVVLLTALVMAVPVSETTVPLAGGRLGGAVMAARANLLDKVQYADGRLTF